VGCLEAMLSLDCLECSCHAPAFVGILAPWPQLLVMKSSHKIKMNSSPASSVSLPSFIADSSPDASQGGDEEDGGHDFGMSRCKANYEENSKAKWCLFSMIVGLIGGDGRQLGDTEAPPYLTMKFRKNLVPTSVHYRNEVARRCNAMDIEAPQCRYWNKDKLFTWLKQHPVTNLLEREWLLKEEQKLFDLLTSAGKEKETVSATNWTDNLVWIRLYFCLYHEKARPFFLTKDDVMDRSELDARNSDNRPPTVYEVVAELFNDPELVFELDPMPDLHHFFDRVYHLDFASMPGPITAEEAKKRLADSRAKLLKLIARWERSGNGFGQPRSVDADDYGHMDETVLEAGDNRARFLEGYKEHLLILWDLGDKEGVLQKFLNKLSKKVAVDPDNIHTDSSEVQNKRRLTDEQKQQKAFRDSIAASMSTMSYAALLQELRMCEAKAVDYKEKAMISHDDDAIAFYEDNYKRQMEYSNTIQEEIARVRKARREED
jgi:hypothetical protein